MLSARRKAAADSQVLAALDSQLHTTQSRVAASRTEAGDCHSCGIGEGTGIRTGDVAATTTHRICNVVARNETNLQTATESMTAATNAVNVATAEHTNRMDLASLLTAALGSAEAAQQKAGDDAVLDGSRDKTQRTCDRSTGSS